VVKLYTSARRWIVPRPALLVAGIALVFAFVSTTIAAPSKSKHHKAPTGLTAAQVRKLIASYLTKHPPAPGAAGATGATGGTGQTGASPFVALTTLNFTGGQRSDVAPSLTTWNRLVNLGTFQKRLSGTHEVVTFSGTGGASPGKSGEHWSCVFQLRVDGKTVSGDASTALSSNGGQTDLAESPNQPVSSAYPMSFTADFSSLAAGAHELTIWDAGNAGACSVDPYNFDSQSALVEEIQTG
jgi:hypothetical protein